MNSQVDFSKDKGDISLVLILALGTEAREEGQYDLERIQFWYSERNNNLGILALCGSYGFVDSVGEALENSKMLNKSSGT